MIVGAVHAADEGAEPLDAVGKAVRHEEVERPVDDGRLLAQSRLAQPVEQLVGRHRPVALEQRVEHEGPCRRQPQPARLALAFGGRARGTPAAAVIVRPEGIHVEGACVIHM